MYTHLQLQLFTKLTKMIKNYIKNAKPKNAKPKNAKPKNAKPKSALGLQNAIAFLLLNDITWSNRKSKLKVLEISLPDGNFLHL